MRVGGRSRPRERARAGHQGLMDVQPAVPRAGHRRSAVRPPSREPVAGGAGRGRRVRGPADPHRRSPVTPTRSAPTSPSTSRATHFFAARRDAGGAGRALRARRCPSSIGAATSCRWERTRRSRSRSKLDQVQIGLPNARFATEDAARAAIESRGGEVSRRAAWCRRRRRERGRVEPARSGPTPPARWTFVVRFPEAQPAGRALRRSSAIIDRTVEIRDARETIATHASELSADRRIPWCSSRARRSRRRLAGARGRRRPHHGARRDPRTAPSADRGRTPPRSPGQR